MKNILLITIFLFSLTVFAQPNTEVYLMDITIKEGKISLSNLRNISNNEGYDNQPSFYDNNTVLFSATRNGQTDIAKYDIASAKIAWLSNTPGGSEYSPQRIPNSGAISAIRLDSNGLQRLYRYEIGQKPPKLIRKDAKVGYHVWYSEDILVNTILVENRMDLVLSKITDGIDLTVAENVGRSLHKIPGTELLSFMSKKEGASGVFSLDPISGKTAPLGSLPIDISDIAWLPDGQQLIPYSSSILSYDPNTKKEPSTLHLFQNKEINKISRMAISPDGKHIALVSNAPSYKIVQKQVDSYNAGNLDAFVGCYSKDVVVSNFPQDTLYVGHDVMRVNYKGLSPENKVWDVKVVNRISIGNIVIDHEKVTGNGKEQMQVAIYEVNNDAIDSMSFIFDKVDSQDPETIVQKQLEAYNARDINGFLATYAKNVQMFDLSTKTTTEGQAKMREGYSGFFESTTDLNCEIKNRIVIGNVVIDEEFITMNGNYFSAIAVYEVENGKIAKVTFL